MNIEIIAEIAQGFEGKPEQSRLLLKAASAAGADAAKYQLVYADELATPDYKYYNLFKSLEMPDDTWQDIANYAKELGIKLQFDIFGATSLNLAERLGVDSIKVHPTDIVNLGLLKNIADSGIKRVIIGAGGAFFSEIKIALEILALKEVVVLVGYQGYPTPNDKNQIERVRRLSGLLPGFHQDLTIGFADHASPDSPLRYALAAMALGKGAKVIEKHLTLGRGMKLEDYESALNPDEFEEFTKILRECSNAMGKTTNEDDFGMDDTELTYRKTIRRHVVTNRDMSKGSDITPGDVTLKRSSSEDAITDISSIYHKIIKIDKNKNNPISLLEIE